MTDIVESWMWRDPEEIIEPLLRRSRRDETKAAKKAAELAAAPAVQERDRYYTQARRLHVKQLMRGK